MDFNDLTSPDKIKNLSIEELEQLSSDIRQFLIEKISKTGGHLGPNLGVVELTIALHYTFNSPKDKIIWDVGHQAYIHKILTGRAGQFDKLRQYKGLSGFPKLSESEHDVWETGHSSTSLSAAMGYAISRDHKKEQNKIIAVIGDGALTGGMSFEALNHIGHEKRNLIVILNDNEMSIAPNVGAIHNYLERMRTDNRYIKAKGRFNLLTDKIPLGDKIFNIAYRFRDSFKQLVVNGMLFEEMGYTYLGPTDGHNFEALFETLNNASKTPGPVLVHVVTKKGKGYQPAEENPDIFHGIGKFDVKTGLPIKSTNLPSYTDVFGDTVVKLAEKDSEIFAITAAMPTGTGLNKFYDVFPERFIDVGIAEQHATTLAAGLAIDGIKPVFAVYSTFLQRAYDQVLHDIARQNLHVVFAVDRAGFVGADGDTHHGIYDIAFLRHIPNTTIMMPKDENELQHMLYTATEYCTGPVVVRYPRGSGVGVKMDEDFQQLPIGKFDIVKKGKKIAILAIGPMVHLAEEAAHELEKRGIFPEIINARFIKPLDEELLLRLANEQYKILTIEEGTLLGGFGSSIHEFYANNNFSNMDISNIGVPDEFYAQGSVKELRDSIGLSVENIVYQVNSLLSSKIKQRA